MATTSNVPFRTAILHSSLLTREQLDQIVASLTKNADGTVIAASAVTDAVLAQKLVENKTLTQYQVQQLQAGRTKFDLGSYWVTDFIGQGGMGQVFKGVHKVMSRECALKVLPKHKNTADAVSSFIREIRTQAQLDNPNLVRAYDAGQDKDVHFLVTEYVPGMDLRRLVRSNGRLTQQQAASVVMQAARALAYAHERGLVHRDVKPGNILVTPEGIAKVSDLGLAGVMHDAENDPRAGRIVGTPDYLAPETIRTHGGQIDPVSDIYSLGCTLYYAVCGKVPFPGGSTRDKACRHLEDTPLHPRRFNAMLDDEFVDLIADMMEKDPRVRISSASEVASRLEQWAGDSLTVISQRAGRSAWLDAPVPIGLEDITEPSQDTEGEASAKGGYNQVTSQVGSGETQISKSGKVSFFPGLPLMLPENTPPATIVAVTLAISVPVSMFLGAALASILMYLFS